MRRLSLFLACALAAAAPARADDYPPALESAPLSAWLRAQTNIPPDKVVAVTPELVVAIVGQTPSANPGGPVRLTLREEVIDPGYVAAVGGRSSLMSMEIQCEGRRVRMEGRSLHPGLNLTGPAEITPASAAWVRIPEGSIMDEVAQAACRPHFDWPLRAPVSPPPAVIAQAAPPPEPEPEPPSPEPQAEPEPDETPPAPVQDVVQPAAPEPVSEVFAVQIGAYFTAERARQAWDALAAERPVLVEGLRFETRPVTVEGRRLLRGLVRDFASRPDAEAFCTATAGGGYGCILRRLTD